MSGDNLPTDTQPTDNSGEDAESTGGELKKDNPEKQRSRCNLERLAHFGTFISAVLTLLLVIIGFVSYRKNVETQSYIAAIGTYRDYLTMESKNNNFVDVKYIKKIKKGTPEYTRYENFANYTFFVSESLFVLSDGDKAWCNTIDLLLEPHIKASTQGLTDEEYGTFHPKFVVYLKGAIKRISTAKDNTAIK